MNRDLFSFVRRDSLYVPADETEKQGVRGRAQVGYSRRFFIGMVAATACAPKIRQFRSLYDTIAGNEKTFSEFETKLAREISPELWIEVGPALQNAFPLVGAQIFQSMMQSLVVDLQRRS